MVRNNSGKDPRIVLVQLLVVLVAVQFLIQPVAAQSLCEVPGASSVMTAAVQLLSGAIAFAGVVKAGGGSVSGVLKGGRGSAQTRKTVVAGAIGIAVGLFFPELVQFVAADVAGQGLDSAGIQCAFGG